MDKFRADALPGRARLQGWASAGLRLDELFRCVGRQDGLRVRFNLHVLSPPLSRGLTAGTSAWSPREPHNIGAGRRSGVKTSVWNVTPRFPGRHTAGMQRVCLPGSSCILINNETAAAVASASTSTSSRPGLCARLQAGVAGSHTLDGRHCRHGRHGKHYA